MSNSQINRVYNSHSTVDAVKWTLELVFIFHFLGQKQRILVCYPSSVNWVHVYSITQKLMSASTGDHIECSFGHICMWMVLLLSWSVEDTLHWRNIYNPRRRITLHLLPQLADQVERHYWVYNLSCVAINQRDILYTLYPWVWSSFIRRLSKLVEFSQVNVFWFS